MTPDGGVSHPSLPGGNRPIATRDVARPARLGGLLEGVKLDGEVREALHEVRGDPDRLAPTTSPLL